MRKVVIVLAFFVTISNTTFGANDKEQANSYDKDWKPAWVNHCRSVYMAIGKSKGFVLQVGDYITRFQAYGKWTRFGDGRTAEDNKILAWCYGMGWNEQSDITVKNGWYLAITQTTKNRGMTSASSLDTQKFISGEGNDGAPMPSVSDPVLARSIVEDGVTYPWNLQVDTVAAAFSDAQFAVLCFGFHDVLNKRPSIEFLANLETIISAFEKQNIVVVISTIPPSPKFNDPEMATLTDEYNIGIRKMAQTRALPLIDYYAEILARRPAKTWQNTLVTADWGPSDHDDKYNPVSNPYTDGGNPATHATGTACASIGYLLRCWLTVQKLKDIKANIVDLGIEDFDKRISDSEAEKKKTQVAAERDRLTVAIADNYVQSGRESKAIDSFDVPINQVTDDKTRLAKLLYAKSIMYIAPLKNYDEASALVQRIIKECPGEAELVTAAAIQLADLATKRGEYTNAIAQYKMILDTYGSKLNGDRLHCLKTRMARTQVENKDFAGAVITYTDLLKENPTVAERATIYDMLGVCYTKLKQPANAVSSYRRILFDAPLRSEVCLNAQKAIFNTYLQAGISDKAVINAVRYFYAANTSASLEEASKCVVQGLNEFDKNLSRGNAFLKFLKSKTEDKSADAEATNVIAAFGPELALTPDADEAKILDEALAKLGGSLEDHRAKGYLNLFFGKPAPALSEFKKVLAQCGSDSKSVQLTINDLGVALKAVHGYPYPTDSLSEFIMYGSKGKDGNQNLTDPLKDY